MALMLRERRERVFLVLAGIFLCAMTLLNVVGITRFIQLGPLALAVGVLPYPLTFLCTDLICELYGRARANFLVSLGLGLNVFILAVLTLGDLAPSVPAENMPPWQILSLSAPVALPNGELVDGEIGLYQLIYATTSGAVFASMLAYIAAQYCDVQLFHFWRRLTNGRHLWLRNNFSTLLSQMVDSVMVVTVTFGAVFLRGEMAFNTLLVLVGSNYAFKALAALLDTIPLYLLVAWLRKYLQLGEHEYAVVVTDPETAV
ncbi:transporter [Luminiphilus syltensis NOR5-1B]|uniref:Probable queuosine precursor transporter n=1 Tax=Luminiphilus syltensis NOR5-1B TaxID=565045 RepID=B8KQC6_9GAMM|nr:queuosine precursor transporter [Luminiphilus syltensis]EED34390.1 transporter [Luminiphilus syltensis NOR5-1B]